MKPAERRKWLTTWFMTHRGEWFSIMNHRFTAAYFLATGVQAYRRPWGSYNELLRHEMNSLVETGLLERRKRALGKAQYGQPTHVLEYRYHE